MDLDPRRLIARLAVAVMIADGRITSPEHDALERLDGLGLGPLSDLAEDEIRRAMHQPIDIRATCKGLSQATPQAATVILAALAEIAASDRSISPGELDVLDTVATLLGFSPADATDIVSAAIATYDATLPPEDATFDSTASVAAHRPRSERVVVIQRPCNEEQEAEMHSTAEVDRSYRLLGVDVGASRAQLNIAYLSLVNRYNPAKVADLGPEFAALAVRKLAEVTAAFETVLDARAGST